MSNPLAWSGGAERFVAWPVTLIVLGETLRRRSAGWAVGLMLLLFVDEILVPETLFVAAPALACVVAAESSTADRGRACGPLCGSPAGVLAPGSLPRPCGRRS